MAFFDRIHNYIIEFENLASITWFFEHFFALIFFWLTITYITCETCDILSFGNVTLSDYSKILKLLIALIKTFLPKIFTNTPVSTDFSPKCFGTCDILSFGNVALTDYSKIWTFYYEHVTFEHFIALIFSD